MKEAPVENRLKNKLEVYGFEVLKLTTPGTSHVMDRMIKMPAWSPAPPVFVEVKRPGKEPRPAQEYTASQWKRCGCDVREFVSTYDEVDALVRELLHEAELRAPDVALPWTRHNEKVQVGWVASKWTDCPVATTQCTLNECANGCAMERRTL